MSGFCPKCGKPVEDRQAFCSSCGTNVGGEAQAEVYMSPQQPYAQPQSQMVYTTPTNNRNLKKKGTLIIILSIIFLVLAGGAVAAIFLLGPYNAKPAELNGEWDCVMKVEQVAKDYASFISEDNKGDERDVQMMLTLDKKGKGKMVISSMTMDTAYKDGKISATSMLDDKLAVTIDAMLKKDKEGLTFNGTWKYTLIKGTGKGEIASGSWIAVLVEPADEQSTAASSAKSQSEQPDATAKGPVTPASSTAPLPSINASITATDMEGSWKGQIVMTDIPGLDANSNISDEDKATMRKDIGSSSEMVFIFKNEKLWIGQESDAEGITENDMGNVSFGGNSFNADVVTPIGKAHVTGDVVEDAGKKLIKCSLIFSEIPAAGTGTEKVTVLASFNGEKQ